MLVLKYIGLVILFIVVSYIVAEFLISAIMLIWVYPFALGYVVAFLQDKGRGFFATPNEQARGFNIIIRVAASVILYIVGFVLMIVLIPHGAIQLGCLIGWATNAYFTVYYEFCSIPMIGRLDRIERNEETKTDWAVFTQLDGEEFQLELDYWEPEEYPVENCRYAVMRMVNYWAFYPLQYED